MNIKKKKKLNASRTLGEKGQSIQVKAILVTNRIQ